MGSLTNLQGFNMPHENKDDLLSYMEELLTQDEMDVIKEILENEKQQLSVSDLCDFMSDPLTTMSLDEWLKRSEEYSNE